MSQEQDGEGEYEAPDTFTRWAVIASGEGGGRIASQFFVRADNPGIEDRILIMNTNRSDLRNTVNRIQNRMEIDDDDAWDRYAFEFGSLQGAGNFFVDGERCAREDLDRIVGAISDNIGSADAFLHVTTLGGGTGNGSIPYLIDQFKSGLQADRRDPWMDSVIHAALGVWPYYYEPPQRHFNAVCGLSRLLRTADGSQNADLVLLAANSHIDDSDEGDDYEGVNQWLIDAIDLMVGAGRETRGVIDIRDLVAVPSQIGAYHFTPAVATGIDGSVFELEYMFDRAADNAFVPLNLGSTRVAYAIVRAPEGMIDRGDVTEPAVQSAFRDWKRENGLAGASGMTTLTPKSERGTDVDVLLLLGGFDLGPLLEHSWDHYTAFKDNLNAAGGRGNDGLTDDQIDRIEENLSTHREINEG